MGCPLVLNLFPLVGLQNHCLQLKKQYFTKMSTEDTRNESVTAAGSQYGGKGSWQMQANGGIFVAQSSSGWQLRDFLNVSLCLITLQWTFLSGACIPCFLLFEHLESFLHTKLVSQQFHCLITRELPSVCFKSSTYCLHFMPPFFSLPYYPKIYKHSAHSFYSGYLYFLF